MNPTVYIETTVIGYLKSRPREDPIVAGHQDTTRDWWQTAADRFALVASERVVRECSAGDQTAAEERLEALAEITLLRTTLDAEQLADALIAGHAVPESHPEDALHIALAAVNGIQYLVSWNFRHIVNAAVRSTIERVCRDAGYEPPIICTPEELLDTTMRNDPIVDEIRRIRQEHTDKFDGDLHAICEDLRRQERESGRQYVSYPPRRTESASASTSADKAT